MGDDYVGEQEKSKGVTNLREVRGNKEGMYISKGSRDKIFDETGG